MAEERIQKPMVLHNFNQSHRVVEAIDNIKDYAIFLLDPNGYILTWNEGAHHLKGYTASEIIGQHFSKFYPQEDIDAGKTEYELQEASLTGRFEDEGWRIRKDGTRFWANVIITAIRNQNGEVTGFSKVTRDLTEKKRAEERLKKMNEELERRVQTRTQELSRAKEDLENAILSRDQFLSLASHELKTPITSLKLQAQVLRTRLIPEAGQASGDRITKSLDSILRQTDRLTSLIENLLDVSRVQLGELHFNYETVNLSDLLSTTISQWIEPLLAAGCNIETDIRPEVQLALDSWRFEQLISSLFSNIVKHAPQSSVKVSLKTEEQFAILSIQDSGPGIDPRKQAMIFERYERSGGPNIGGLGLGLFLAKNIVEAHHGTIEVRNEPQRGTLFIVRVPINLNHVRPNDATLN